MANGSLTVATEGSQDHCPCLVPLRVLAIGTHCTIGKTKRLLKCTALMGDGSQRVKRCKLFGLHGDLLKKERLSLIKAALLMQ